MLLAFFVLLLLAILSPVARAFDAEPLVRAWQTEDGLPSDTVRAIAQTPDGFLWLGTEAGLARFDGVRFVPYNLGDDLPALPVRALLATRDGALWIGGPDLGAIRLYQGSWTHYFTKDGLPSDSVRKFSEGPDGRVWIATDGGAVVWDREGLTALPRIAKSNGVDAIVARMSGEVWAHFSDHGVKVLRNGAWSAPDPLSPVNLDSGAALGEDAEHRVWVATRTGEVLRFGEDGWKQYSVRALKRNGGSRPIAFGPNGEVYVGYLGAGLWQLRGEEFVPVHSDPGSGEPLVEALQEDASGQLWVGTFSSGILRLTARNLQNCRLDPVDNTDVVRALVEPEPGVIWAGTQGAGLWRWQDGQASQLSSAPEAAGIIYGNAAVRARDGTVWFACYSTLLHFTDPSHASRVDFPNGNSVGSWLALTEDAAGTIWVAGNGGQLAKVRNGSLENVPQGHSPSEILALASTADGAIWEATAREGVRRIADGKVAAFTVASGLRSNQVTALAVDSDGTLWAGTAGGGLARYRDGKFDSVGFEAGLMDDTITQILDDGEGQLWLAGPRGLAAISRQQLAALFGGQAKVVHPRFYGRQEGMASPDCPPSVPIRLASGLLAFATKRGFVTVDPHQHAPVRSSPQVFLDSVWVNGEPQFQASTLRKPSRIVIGPDVSRLEVSYTAPDLVGQGRLQFRYRLSGLDEAWHKVGTQRSINFNHLPPGEYQLEIAIDSSRKDISEQTAKLGFLLQPHFWQEKWFYAACALAMGIAIAAVVHAIDRRRAARKLAVLERQRAIDGERARIARDLHDDLGGSLTEMALLSELAQSSLGDPERARSQLDHIFTSAQNSARALDEIVWAANPANDRVRSFVAHLTEFAQTFAHHAGLTCRVSVPNSLSDAPLSAPVRHHLYLAVKEALNNAAKHSGAKEMAVELEIVDGIFRLSVKDDGCGFDTAAPSENGADGLANMRSRLAEIGGTVSLRSAPGQGTAIGFAIPLDKLGCT